MAEENKGEYLEALCSKAKKNLDGFGVTPDNVKKISEYAHRMYTYGRFDEAEAEYHALQKVKR